MKQAGVGDGDGNGNMPGYISAQRREAVLMYDNLPTTEWAMCRPQDGQCADHRMGKITNTMHAW